MHAQLLSVCDGGAATLFAADHQHSGVRLVHTRDHVHQGRLTGTVVSEDHQDLSRARLERGTAKRLNMPKTLRDLANAHCTWRDFSLQQPVSSRSSGCFESRLMSQLWVSAGSTNIAGLFP